MTERQSHTQEGHERTDEEVHQFKQQIGNVGGVAARDIPFLRWLGEALWSTAQEIHLPKEQDAIVQALLGMVEEGATGRLGEVGGISRFFLPAIPKGAPGMVLRASLTPLLQSGPWVLFLPLPLFYRPPPKRKRHKKVCRGCRMSMRHGGSCSGQCGICSLV